MSEHDEQAAFIQWCSLSLAKYPELKWIHAIPNGGKRGFKTAKSLKAEGVKPGVFDVFLPISRGIFHGLYIEFKFGKNKLTSEQAEFMKYCQENDYKTAVCYSGQDAAQIVVNYLRIGV
jgi:hypothetical protein